MGIGISIFPITFSIIRDKFPPEKLAIGQGIFTSTLSGGGVIGLIIGGGIVESYGWRAIFLFMSASCSNTFCSNRKICTRKRN